MQCGAIGTLEPHTENIGVRERAGERQKKAFLIGILHGLRDEYGLTEGDEFLFLDELIDTTEKESSSMKAKSRVSTLNDDKVTPSSILPKTTLATGAAHLRIPSHPLLAPASLSSPPAHSPRERKCRQAASALGMATFLRDCHIAVVP